MPISRRPAAALAPLALVGWLAVGAADAQPPAPTPDRQPPGDAAGPSDAVDVPPSAGLADPTSPASGDGREAPRREGLAPPPPPGDAPDYGQPPSGYASAAAAADGRAPGRAPVRYVEREIPVRALWIPGLIVLPAAYVYTISFAQESINGSYRDRSFIPLVGPWLMLGVAHEDWEIAGAIAGGIAQLVGAGLLILGLSLRKTVRVAADGRGARVGLLPWASARGGGLAVHVEEL
ncbi:MAG: hypothetical protein ACFCGT_07185 [Sandaracinaceae bacterium]